MKVVKEEVWKDVVGYEGLYKVSDFGRVKSLARVVKVNRRSRTVERNIAEKLLKPATMKSGHLQVSLANAGKSSTLLVHILVLEAHLGPRPGDSMNWHGCHGDGNEANNYLNNLRWDTRSANEMDKIAHGRSNRGARNRASKLNEDQVLEIKRQIALGEKSPEIALNYGVTRAAINAIKRGRAWNWL